MDADNVYPFNVEKEGWAKLKMKENEFILLAIGAVAGAYVRYKIVENPLALGSFPVNVLVVNVLGSFILGVFAVLAST